MKRLIILLFLSLSFVFTTAQDKSAFVKTLFISKGGTLPVRILYPENFDKSKKYPLMLFLHGRGESGNDNERQLIHGSKMFLKPGFIANTQYWKNGVDALNENKRLCNDLGKTLRYSDTLWGLTAFNGKNGYLGFSSDFDGTIAPSAIVAAIPFIPENAIPSLKCIYQKFSTKIWGKNGFLDAFNPSQGWYDTGFLGIDKGNEVLMIENFRSGLILNSS